MFVLEIDDHHGRFNLKFKDYQTTLYRQLNINSKGSNDREVKLAHTCASEYQHREDPTVKHESENNRRLSCYG